MAVYRAKKTEKPQGGKERQDARRRTRAQMPVTDDAMGRLAQLMNDSPTMMSLHGTEWEIHALKPGTQWLIAEEACKIVDRENMTTGDVLRQFAVNLPSVCRVLTLALLNDKGRIHSDEYNQVYETLMWGAYKMRDWAVLLSEILNLVDVNFFFEITSVVKTLRRSVLDRKMTAAEQR